jgi:hypothetical protein
VVPYKGGINLAPGCARARGAKSGAMQMAVINGFFMVLILDPYSLSKSDKSFSIMRFQYCVFAFSTEIWLDKLSLE